MAADRLGILGPTLVGTQVVTGIEGALLGLLALHANRPVPRRTLVGALWPDADEERGGGRLRTYIWRVRRAGHLERVGARLGTASDGYVLDIPTDRLDTTEMQALLARADEAVSQGGWEVGRTALEAALRLWRGRPLPEIDNPTFWAPEVTELEEDHQRALELLAEVELRLGHGHQATARLHQLARDEPGRVRRWQLLIEALHSSGRAVEALAVAREAHHRLTEEGDLHAVELIDQLEGAILRHETRPTELSASRRPISQADSGLVGRDVELAHLDQAWERAQQGATQVVLISGPAGAGASALAEECARRLRIPAVHPGSDLAGGHGGLVVVDQLGKASPHKGSAEASRLPLAALTRWCEDVPQGTLLLIIQTSPRHEAAGLCHQLARTLGPPTEVHLGPLMGPLLDIMIQGRAVAPADRSRIALESAGLPGLVVDLTESGTEAPGRMWDRLDRWARDLSPEDRTRLGAVLTDIRVDVAEVTQDPEGLELVDTLDRAVELGLLVPDPTAGPGGWRLATPLLGRVLTRAGARQESPVGAPSRSWPVPR